jgi:hypothetical protein
MEILKFKSFKYIYPKIEQVIILTKIIKPDVASQNPICVVVKINFNMFDIL